MNTKLTLTIDDSVIEMAKRYAKSKQSSLSSIIENYLKILVKTKVDNVLTDDLEISPMLKSMQGTIKVPKDFDYKKELQKGKEQKYL